MPIGKQSRRRFITATGGAAALGTVAGCLGGGDDDVVNYFSWGAYIDDSWIQPFEEDTGITVNTETYESNADAINQIETAPEGTYDVWTPSAPGADFERAYQNDLLDPINLDNVPAWDEHIFEEMKLDDFWFDDELYAVPMTFGFDGAVYNHEEVGDLGDEISYDVLWDDEYAGEITSRDDAATQIWTAAKYLGQDPDEPEDLDAIEDALNEHVDLVNTYWTSSAESIQIFQQGEASIGTSWDGAYHRLAAEDEPVSLAFWEEGTIGWIDSFCIARGSENKEEAEQFIDYMVSEVPRAWFEGPEYIVVSDAVDYTDEELDEYNLEMALENTEFPAYNDDDQIQTYDEIWTDVTV
ncbi:extracellular solute-binding protein [Natrialba sp. SSL1]|uniref:extracellular solute-binding protein n=1 Tax=Natrialba sp. SSL1 TaxID=1869245 RepID=UPI0008F831AD|nr:extracellular solute-binding protein [Natrialba sp. SSL1]OIB59024.1 ABC transporter substrate-binding protein [Natrialba sp. SSL1]